MVIKTADRMEVLFGFFGTLFLAIILLITACLTPGYTPLKHTVSSLGRGPAKSLFSIGFVVAGSLLIPFFIYLERELVNIEDHIRRFATGISIFTSVCCALVGIIPDETYIDAFHIFHSFVAFIAFAGTSIYIVLYSILMYYGPKSKMYKGPKFMKFLAYYGFIIGGVFILLMITLSPLVEWILTLLTIGWVLITGLHCIAFKFFNISGMYYKRSQYPEALTLFENAVELLDKLKLSNDPIAETLKENIEYIKKEMNKKSKGSIEE